jgi:hypothetical protein
MYDFYSQTINNYTLLKQFNYRLDGFDTLELSGDVFEPLPPTWRIPGIAYDVIK